MDSIRVPVLIIGGGAVGLSTSIFLSNLGIEHLLVEAHSGTSLLPKAHYLNQRTMEIYRDHGVADVIFEKGAKLEDFGVVVWKTSLGGTGPFDGIEIGKMDVFGGGSLAAAYTADSATRGTNLPLLRLEPLLRAEAEKRTTGRVRFHHRVLEWTEGPSGVTAFVEDRDAGTQYSVAADYVVVADGGKTVGPKIGISMEGPTNIGTVISTHFKADLSAYVADDTLITWFVDPKGQLPSGFHALVKMGPTWTKHSEEWTVHMIAPPGAERPSESAVKERLRAILLPGLELDLEVLYVSMWTLDRVVADRWRVGRMFLAGDAAHRQPPTSGLGLNTGVQDGHNLAWKLAAVVRGHAGPELLDSYERERRPVSTFGADWAMLTLGNHAMTDAGLGLSPAQPPERNLVAFGATLLDSPLGRTLRARAAEARSTQRIEFQNHDVELGFVYEEGAVIPDGSEPAPHDPMGSVYVPNARPGARLPHAWIPRPGGPRATHDLADSGGLTLFTDGEPKWGTAAEEVARRLGLGIRLVVVGRDEKDSGGSWQRTSGLAPGGALLVRPDKHVAWRARELTTSPSNDLESAVRAVMAR